MPTKMAGHSHWAKIKRAKSATDAKRGKVWSKIARKIIIAARNGGNLASSGAVAFQFTKQGIVTIRTNSVNEDKLLELALDAGAEDVKNQGEVLEVITSPTEFLKVKDAIAAANIPIENAEITNLP